MRCREVAEQLSAYVDGELELDERREVEKHVADCAGCHAELQTLRQMDSEFLAGLPPMEPSPSVFPMLLDRIAVKPTPWYLNFWKLGWVVAGATACMLMLSIGMEQIQAYNEEQEALSAIDAYQPGPAVKNVFSTARDQTPRHPFDYRARLTPGSPFHLTSYSHGVDGIKGQEGDQ